MSKIQGQWQEVWKNLRNVQVMLRDSASEMPIEIQREMGTEIARKRRARGITQRQMATAIFCSTSVISAIEHGAVFHNMDHYYMMCFVLHSNAAMEMLAAQFRCLASPLKRPQIGPD